MSEKTDRQKEIASRLALARKQAGLTQKQVAEMLELHRPSVSEIEAGRRKVSADELSNLAEIYGVNTEWLLGVSGSGADEERVQLAARELSKLSDEDLERVLNLLTSLKETSK